ncbi:MAG: hypothetical protein NW220_08850 [Leptolyngbyaceae cyanobacterium bins.349]|nr:hypothetical protein [Leptolyngbyaceae cyanobacterium bins.349]
MILRPDPRDRKLPATPYEPPRCFADTARVRLLLQLMKEYYNPKNPESDLVNLKVRVEALERRLGQV